MLSLSWSALRLQRIWCGIFLGLLFMCWSLPAAGAQSNSAIAQQFQTQDSSITAASLVATVQDNPYSVELATIDHADRLTGVVSNEPLIELSTGGSGVQVVTSGLTMVLVTDLNGSVAAGDKITISPIEGVGMKALDTTTIVGISQSDLAKAQTETRTITDKSGKEKQVKIGLVQVLVGVAYYVPEGQQSSYVPSFLQNLANSVSGRSVSPMRVLIAALILLLLFISITVLLYSAVRSSIISIGRNPLSQGAIRKSLLQVGLTVTILLLFAMATIYLILTL
jgi:hypothetical protein